MPDRGLYAPPPPRLGVADLQTHTTHSDGIGTPDAMVRWADAHTDLDVLAVTDHDDLSGAVAARTAAERLSSRVQVIVGMEITTRGGHLLALFLEDPVPSFRSLASTLEAVHAQGGLCVVPHPLSVLPPSIGRRAIDRLGTERCDGRHLDAVELANPAHLARLASARVRRLNARRWHLAETGGSDAHLPEAIGGAVTRFPGSSADDLRRALLAGLTVAEMRTAIGLREIGPRRLATLQLRALIATPRNAVWRPLRSRLDRRRPGIG